MNTTFNRVPGEIDKRLEHAVMMEKLVKMPEFQFYQSLLNERRIGHTYAVLSLDVENKVYRAKLLEVDEIIGIPENIIQKGRHAQNEENEE